MRKPTFYELRVKHGGNLLNIAQAAQVDALIVWYAVLRGGVTKEDAEKVLQGFNRMHGTRYRLDDVDIVLA